MHNYLIDRNGGQPLKRFNIDATKKKIQAFLNTHRKYTDWKTVLNLYTPAKEDFLYQSIPLG